jgi:hypothetical protein
VWATSDGPRIEDFGISEHDLARVPKFVVASHRTALLVGVYLMAASVSFWVMLSVGGSWSAAAFFTVIVLAAVSVLLLPVAFLAVCAGERAEERWLCRRFPALRACLAYRKAVADHRRRSLPSAPPRVAPEVWRDISLPACLVLMGDTLNTRACGDVTEIDRETAGFDFLVVSDGRRLLLRCEPGPNPVSAAVGRELAAALIDFDADAAWIVAAAEPTPALEDYVADRPITVLGPGELTETIRDSEFRIPNS